jgi:hypothetical protein
VTVTETPEVARRLDLAAARFPERAASRSDLLVALTEVAEQALLRGDVDDGAAARARLLERSLQIDEDEAERILEDREAAWDRDPPGT